MSQALTPAAVVLLHQQPSVGFAAQTGHVLLLAAQ
jgi:hypothetical protein